MKNNFNGSKLIRVKVFPQSTEENYKWKGKDNLVIKIKEKAENNKANKKVFEILSLIFPEKRIELKKGSKSKNKIFKIYERKQQ
jgi:uncharacterized protein (TIGR00251 family)